MGPGTPITITGILIALLGFIDVTLATVGDSELQALRYILAVLGLILMAIGALLQQMER